MRKFLLGLMLVMSFGYTQTPIIRLMQSREYKTPKFWWRDQVTHSLRTYLADDTSEPANKNNNFDAWRDDVMTVAVTIDDNAANVSIFRLDIIFDNDIFTWSHDSTHVQKGAHIAGWTEGDNALNGHYSYEVVRYANIGYTDGIASNGNEISVSDSRYDWLRITMVSHNVATHKFGGGNGVQKELLKLHFKVNDVADNFNPRAFRVATEYQGGVGWYTYVTNGNYLTAYKVFIDGNYGTESTNLDGARGDITLHPKLVDVEGYYRYIQGNGRGVGAVWDYADADPVWERGPIENTYPYWKVKFELDRNEANFNPRITNWYNLEVIANDANAADEDGSDDVIGDHTATFLYDKKSTTSAQVLPKEGFLGISYYDSTYTDDKGYYQIQLPRNNRYRVSFWPPDDSDDIETHDQFDLDRGAITNVADAIASFNFQSGKHHNYNAGTRASPSTRIDTLTALEYLVGDVDGDDLFFLNDTYILWSYSAGLFSNYTHHTGRSHEDWSTIEVFKEGGNALNYGYYNTVNGQTRLNKYEYTIYWDENTTANTNNGGDRASGSPTENDGEYSPITTTRALATNQKALAFGHIETINPLMDDHQTGLDTLHLILGNGYSSWAPNRTDNDDNPDYLMPDVGYYFTGDINATGTKVIEVDDSKTGRATTGLGSAGAPYSAAATGTVSDGYIDNEGTTYYRWAGGSVPGRHAQKINDTNDESNTNNILSGANNFGDFVDGVDVTLSLPADSTVRVQSGNQIEVPLTITPKEGVLIAGFEFEVEFKVDELDFIDMKTDVLPGPWMTYVNVHEVVNGWQRVSFGGINYTPSNSPETYHIENEIVGLKLLFKADFPDTEWTEAPIRFVGKHAAGSPAGRDLSMDRKDGKVMVWNKYWAFGGGKPDGSALTYNYPNPFIDNTTFQFYLDKPEDTKLYILNSMGQRVGTLLDEHILKGLHTFEFTNTATVFLPEVSVYENHKTLEPGVYIFVLQTNTRIKSSKFTVVK